MNKTELIDKILHLGYTTEMCSSTDKHKAKELAHTLIDEYLEAINYSQCCKSDSEQLPNKWKERCLLAENYINETPCDPDIYQKQQEAWSDWITYKKAMENTK
jgi:hypothetical protein